MNDITTVAEPKASADAAPTPAPSFELVVPPSSETASEPAVKNKPARAPRGPGSQPPISLHGGESEFMAQIMMVLPVGEHRTEAKVAWALDALPTHTVLSMTPTGVAKYVVAFYEKLEKASKGEQPTR